MKVVFVLIILGLFTSCSSKAKRAPKTLEQKTITSSNQEVQVEFDSAFELLNAKSFSPAAEAFRRFQAQHPSDSLASVANLYQFRAELGDFSQVDASQAEQLRALASTTGIDERVRWAATLYHAIVLQNLEQKDAAIGALEMYPSASLSPLILSYDENLSWVLISEAMLKSQRYTDALFAHDAMFQRGTETLKTFATSKAFLAAVNLKDSELEALTTDKESGFIRAIMGVTLMERWLAGDSPPNKDALVSFYDRIQPDLVSIDAQARGERVLSQISNMGAPRKKIVAIVVPMTGRNKTLGDRILKTLYFGIGAFEKGESTTTFIVRDSNLDPAATMNEFQEKGVSLVIGPLERTRAAAFSVESKRLNLPHLSLAMTEFADTDTSVRYAMDAEAEVQRVVDIAIKNGDQRFAVLSSATQYSEQMKIWFKRIVKEKGGSIVLEKTFDRKDTDFTKLAEATKTARPDAVFIPETGKVVGNISAFMAHVNVWGASITSRPDPKSSRIGVHYLGTSMWYQDSLVRQSSQYVKHAVIPVWSSKIFDDKKSKHFYENFKTELGRKPSSLDAFAFDAAQIAIRLLEGSSNPSVILSSLRTLNMTGVTGEIRGSQTELVNEIRLLTVKRKAFAAFE